MCIIAAKAAGVPMPSRDTIRNMWDANRDGAGLMYVEKGQVRIEKGFMKYKDFTKVLDRLEKRLDLTATPVVMHFRITTHGGTKPENTHPFPISDNVGALKKLTVTTDVGVAHNGIIHSVDPRKGISDTMEYIASQLAPLKKALPRFYENKNAMLLVKNAIESKMVFLTKDGKLYTIGDFTKDGGMLYSNTSYKGYVSRFRNFTFGNYGLDEWETYTGYDYAGKTTHFDPKKSKITQPEAEIRNLMWLDDGDYIITPEGDMYEGFVNLIDENGTVYEYDWDDDCATPMPGAEAKSAEGLPVRYCENLAEPVYVSL